jgi:serine/threonine protein phosphatase PrpC
MEHLSGRPNTKKLTSCGQDEHHYYVVSSMQGWRNGNEDTSSAELADDVALFGVYDGHGGDLAHCEVY